MCRTIEEHIDFGDGVVAEHRLGNVAIASIWNYAVTPMKVLVTGHNGYIGAVMVPFLQKAGHEVVGLDTYLFEGCHQGPAPVDPPALRMDLRDVKAEHLEGFDDDTRKKAVIRNNRLCFLLTLETHAIC